MASRARVFHRALLLLCALLTLAPSFAHAGDNAPITAEELNALQKLARGDTKASVGLQIAMQEGRNDELRSILRTSNFKGSSYGPAELRDFRNAARKFASDVPERAEEASASIKKINEALKETDGRKYIESHGGGKEGRRALMDKFGKIPTAEDAVTTEMTTGRPSVGQDGSQYWHAEKVAGRTQQLESELADLERIRDKIPRDELAKINPKLPDQIDDAIANARRRIDAMKPALESWNNRSKVLPSVWKDDGTSLTALPGDRPVPTPGRPGPPKVAATRPPFCEKPPTPPQLPRASAPAAPAAEVAAAEVPAARLPPSSMRGAPRPTVPPRPSMGPTIVSGAGPVVVEALAKDYFAKNEAYRRAQEQDDRDAAVRAMDYNSAKWIAEQTKDPRLLPRSPPRPSAMPKNGVPNSLGLWDWMKSFGR